jgi:hypothetical protein
MSHQTTDDTFDNGADSAFKGIPASTDTEFELTTADAEYRRRGGMAVITRGYSSAGGPVVQVDYQAVANDNQQLCAVFGTATLAT